MVRVGWSRVWQVNEGHDGFQAYVPPPNIKKTNKKNRKRTKKKIQRKKNTIHINEESNMFMCVWGCVWVPVCVADVAHMHLTQ